MSGESRQAASVTVTPWANIGLRRAHVKLHTYINGSPVFCPIFFRFKSLGGVFPSRLTDVCIEGFPRSGNSYAVHLVQHYFGGIEIAHHTHRVAALKMAANRKIPTIVLLRNPVEAVASNVLRGEKDLANKFFRREDRIVYELRFYEAFNNYILDNHRRIEIVKFETLISDPRYLLQIVASVLDKELLDRDLDQLASDVVATIEKYESGKQAAAESSALPQSEKRDNLEEVKSLIFRKDYEDILSRCLEVYERLNAYTTSQREAFTALAR